MNPDTVRIILTGTAAYMLWKTASAPKRGTFLTLFGNIRRESRPGVFRVCLIAGYNLAVALLLAAIFPDVWFPVFRDL